MTAAGELMYNDEVTANQWALNSAVECHLHTVEVTGSNPVAPTIQLTVAKWFEQFRVFGSLPTCHRSSPFATVSLPPTTSLPGSQIAQQSQVYVGLPLPTCSCHRKWWGYGKQWVYSVWRAGAPNGKSGV